MSPENTMKLPREAGPVFTTDVTASEMDDNCGMKFWLSKYESGRGIIKQDAVVGHLLDTQIHDDLALVAQLEDISAPNIQRMIDEIISHLTATDKQEIPKMELLYRRLGWLAAFALYMEPDIRANYENLPIDPALVLDKEPLWVITYPDRLLRSRVEKSLVVYREYVSVAPGQSMERWMQSWQYNIRLHVGLAAAQQTLQDPTMKPSYGQIMGLSTGYRSLMDTRLVHPYVWGWYCKEKEEWTNNTSNRAGSWVKMPVWDFPGGVVEWVKMCGRGIGVAQFPMSSPVYLNKEVLEGWTSRRLHREREIQEISKSAHLNKHLRTVYFGQTTNQCYPMSGNVCPFVHACWDREGSKAPLKSGLYIKMTPTLEAASR